MNISVIQEQLIRYGLSNQEAAHLVEKLSNLLQSVENPEHIWQIISQEILTPNYPFDVHLFFFQLIFPNWLDQPESAPAWIPRETQLKKTNLFKFMAEKNKHHVKEFHQWTVTHFQDFWSDMTQKLPILFKKNVDPICDLSEGIESPRWFPGATMNIVDSCFTATPEATALIYENEQKQICRLTYGELENLSNQIANSLITLGLTQGDAIGIVMPMTPYAVAIYLGIIKMGGIVVSIADSFSSDEIAVRLNIANTKAVFTQDFFIRDNKTFPLYEKFNTISSRLHSIKVIVVPHKKEVTLSLAAKDTTWNHFLISNTNFTSVACDPMATCNILFSSGTTADPKAIPWNHTTAIKAASDAFLHHDIQATDILAWPTNLGWMMGPWLIFAALINQAAIALYTDVPKDRPFGQFIQDTGVTLLGVVPTLVATWRKTKCMEKLNWQAIKRFSSTGECSNPEDMLYLMFLAGYKPIIEYCGGTEIGGAYVTSTLLEKNYPSLFSTPTMGLNFIILDEEGHPAKNGEVAIIPPSIGLSTHLLNANHHQVYFANMPIGKNNQLWRRHGDQIEQLANGYYRLLGRVDDAMNLGGIKVSAAEIERVLTHPSLLETAAIAVSPPQNGPSQLIIYAVTTEKLQKKIIMDEMQKKINLHLNPLFKIHDIVFINELPKTASNKIMRRLLRKEYLATKG